MQVMTMPIQQKSKNKISLEKIKKRAKVSNPRTHPTRTIGSKNPISPCVNKAYKVNTENNTVVYIAAKNTDSGS